MILDKFIFFYRMGTSAAAQPSANKAKVNVGSAIPTQQAGGCC
jgi:hypothetical protein